MFSLLPSSASQQPLSWHQQLIPAATTDASQHEPSVLDRLAAPTVFLSQALVFATPLCASTLQAAVAAVVTQYLAFGARLTAAVDGQLTLVPHSAAAGTAGVALLHAQSTTLTLQQLLPPLTDNCSSQQVQVPELPDLLFEHLPGSLTPDYVNSELPLVHVALLQLAGGSGSVLGVRMSHLLGDWSSCRLLLRSLAAAYTHAVAAGSTGTQPTQPQERLLPAARLLNQLVAAVHQQRSQEWAPVRLKPLQQADSDRFAKLAALSSSADSSATRPVRLTYLIPRERLQQLKQELLAEAAEAADSSSSAAPAATAWCSSHNALLASLLKAFGSLPGRQQLPHDVSVAVDMRGRLPPAQQQQQLAAADRELLQCSVGNFFASAIADDVQVQRQSRAQLAQALAAAVDRAADVWLPDLAWAAGFKGLLPRQPQQCTDAAAAAAAADSSGGGGEITWRRLHAMGPTALLPQQMALGLLASLSTTQWPLDYATDAAFAGQLPLLSVPSFSQPQPYPLVLTQQATPAQADGGWVVHVFLDAGEAAAMQAALAAQGGP